MLENTFAIFLTNAEAVIMKNLVIKEIEEFKKNNTPKSLTESHYFGYLGTLYDINARLPKPKALYQSNENEVER